MLGRGGYLWRILGALDQLLNTVLGGDPDETVSSRCGKRLPACRICAALCGLLSVFDPDHCRRAIELDEGRS